MRQEKQRSANYSAQNLNNNYQSMVDQSGIYAGSGGFNITAGDHTQLDGAVIASDASADKNHLSTKCRPATWSLEEQLNNIPQKYR